MAAADYYNGTRPTDPQASPFLTAAQPERRSSNPGFPYSPQPPTNPSPQQQQYFPPPPPYQNTLKPNVHFAPSLSPQQRNSFSHPQRPSPQSWNPQYPQQHLPLPPQGPNLQPLQYQPQPAYAYQAKPPYPAPYVRPYINGNESEMSLEGGYASEPEPHRRRHRHKDKQGRSRGVSDSSRSETTDGLLGAAGGGLIGDLIFPGLGTVGGALAGWLGGKDYGKHRKHREETRSKQQRDWERKHGSRDRERSRDDDDSDRRDSHDRKRSHE